MDNMIYYINVNGKQWDVIREGYTEGESAYIGTYSTLTHAQEVVAAHIDWIGGELYEK